MKQEGTKELSPEELSRPVVGACIEVHRQLGPGLLESAYEHCLAYELESSGFEVQRQVSVPIRYKGRLLECEYRADLVVNQCLLVEVKAVETVLPVHRAQVITYLKLLSLPMGLLINFHVPLLRQGIRRLINPAAGVSLPDWSRASDPDNESSSDLRSFVASCLTPTE